MTRKCDSQKAVATVIPSVACPTMREILGRRGFVEERFLVWDYEESCETSEIAFLFHNPNCETNEEQEGFRDAEQKSNLVSMTAFSQSDRQVATVSIPMVSGQHCHPGIDNAEGHQYSSHHIHCPPTSLSPLFTPPISPPSVSPVGGVSEIILQIVVGVFFLSPIY